MNLLYWNLKSNKNYNYIVSLIKGYSIDVAIFSEYKIRDKSSVFDDVCFEGYQFHLGNGGCDKVIMLAKNDIHVEINREQSRYVIYSVISGSEKYNIVGTHLPPNPYIDTSGRKIVIRDIISDLKEQETRNKHSNSIIIGDLNASPFDRELVDKDGFNAVLYREIIENKTKVKFNGKYFRLLYNPVIDCISENNKQYGSFYRSNGIDSLYWYCFDQVLVARELVPSFKMMEYCRSVGGKSLISKTRPDPKISDHLPLIVKFERRFRQNGK